MMYKKFCKCLISHITVHTEILNYGTQTRIHHIKSLAFSTQLALLPNVTEVMISQYKKKSNPPHKPYLPIS